MSSIKHLRTTLSNDLTLVTIEVPGAKSVMIQFAGKAGTRYNPEDKEGLAHFLEHILIKKTKKYPSDAKLAYALESFGGWKNGWTAQEDLVVWVNCASKHLKKATAILAEMIFNPLIDEAGVNAERKVIEKEIARRNSQPEDLLWELTAQIFFPDSSLQFSVLGTETSLKQVDKKDLEDFWQKNLVSQDSVLIIGSPFDSKTVKALAEETFGKEKLNPPKKVPIFKYQRKESFILKYFNLPQTACQLNFRLDKEDFDELPPLAVLQDLLVAGWASRFSQRLRVKESLVYNWRANTNLFLDTRELSFHLATGKENFYRLIKILSEELRKIRDQKITESELKRVKGYREGRLLANTETPADYVQWYDYRELLWPKESESIEEWIAKIKKVTAKQVQEVAQKYFRPDNWYLAVAGDVEKEKIKVEL